jgi:hypothetical protein
MAKKASERTRLSYRGRRKSSAKSPSAESLLEKPLENIDLRKLNGPGIKKIIREIYKSPLAMYLAGGVGAFFIGRFAYRYYQDHPEISDFIKENFDTMESRLREFRSEIMDGDVARH